MDMDRSMPPYRGITPMAYLSGLMALILMLVWLLHYREGLEYDSDNPYRVFNVTLFASYIRMLISSTVHAIL
jgi:hypothetical protein